MTAQTPDLAARAAEPADRPPDTTARTPGSTPRAARLLGFGPFVRKELGEWRRQRGALVTFLVVAALGTVGTLATRIDEAMGGVPSPGMLDPTANILGAQFDQWVTMAAVFASIGLLVPERASGTLAWTLSKPVSRVSVLLAKWSAAVLVLGTFGVVLPLAWMSGVATVAYGALPDLAVVARFGAVLPAVPALFVALNLALATKLDAQAGIAAIAIGVAFAPYFLVAFAPSIAELWPASIARLAAPVAIGEPAILATVASWAITIAVAGVAGAARLAREDL